MNMSLNGLVCVIGPLRGESLPSYTSSRQERSKRKPAKQIGEKGVSLKPIPTQGDNHHFRHRPLIACTGISAFSSGPRFPNSHHTSDRSVGGTWLFSSFADPNIRPPRSEQPPAQTIPPV